MENPWGICDCRGRRILEAVGSLLMWDRQGDVGPLEN